MTDTWTVTYNQLCSIPVIWKLITRPLFYNKLKRW